jgi:hypothetical protein
MAAILHLNTVITLDAAHSKALKLHGLPVGDAADLARCGRSGESAG